MPGICSAELCPAAVGFGRTAGGHRFPYLGVPGWVCGTRREYVHVGSSKTSMFLTFPQTHPGTPQTDGRWSWGMPRQHQRRCRFGVMRFRMLGISQRSSVDRSHRSREWILIFDGHRPAVDGGSGWAGGGMSRMDAAIEPTWVKAHRLRGTASRATEHPAAGGWAGPRRGTCGVPRNARPEPPNQGYSDHRLFAKDQQQPGRARLYVDRAIRRCRSCNQAIRAWSGR